MEFDVIVVGGGNAALCAALSAAEQGARVAVLERAPEEERGGNSAFAGGTFRAVYSGLEDVQKLVDLSDAEIVETDFGSYSSDQFYDDMARVTRYRTDPDLCEMLVTRSRETVQWLRSQGLRFIPAYWYYSVKTGDKRQFRGGVVVEIVGGGKGLINGLYATAERRNIAVHYEAHVTQLLYSDRQVRGVRVDTGDRTMELASKAVVLACGGFEANVEWRTRYLGPGWDLAKVRGSRFNTGDGIRMALEVGAAPHGNWSGCHATEWDLNAPDFGDHSVGDKLQKHCYEFGVIINNDGRRFVDEGADLRTYTYAKYGREILAQPGQAAWQIFDSKVLHLLRRGEYYNKRTMRVRADTLEELLAKMHGINAAQALKTLREYNAAVMQDVPFDPNVRDGRGTQGLALPKSNWANTLQDGPFEAYAVTCGITFTFGGVKITPDAAVTDIRNRPLRGLYAAGEMAGGIFYFNYPGSSGLTSGSVFGRIAGRSAALYATARTDTT